jgi:hypothetical protein
MHSYAKQAAMQSYATLGGLSKTAKLSKAMQSCAKVCEAKQSYAKIRKAMQSYAKQEATVTRHRRLLNIVGYST